ncbi:MAG: hypothetical protein AB7N76_31895 [Planctomycetota bacterium]
MATVSKGACPSCRRERLLTRFGRCTVCGELVAVPRTGGFGTFLAWVLREVVTPLVVFALVIAGVRTAWSVGQEGGGNLALVSLGALTVMLLLASMSDRERSWRRTG